MKPGAMTAVDKKMMASLPTNHELMWTTPNAALSSWRAYCRCGWVAAPFSNHPGEEATARAQFINHLLDLQNV